MSESMHWLEPAFMNPADLPVSPEVHLERLRFVRLLRESFEGRVIEDEEVLSWHPIPDEELTLSYLLKKAFTQGVV